MREPGRLPGQSRLAGAAVVVACVTGVLTAGQVHDAWKGVPRRASRHSATPRDRRRIVWRSSRGALGNTRSLQRDPRVGYLRSLLDALDLSPDSQLLVFSKTGVQSASHEPPESARAVLRRVGCRRLRPGRAGHRDGRSRSAAGRRLYTVDQNAAAPQPVRRTSCLSCHVSASTLYVPGSSRSNMVGDDGSVLPRTGFQRSDHQTPHPDRWGGWFVTTEKASIPYAQRAHEGNITFSGRGNTSNQVFVDWLDSAPETRGYLSSSSDIVTLLVFDHQMHAVNLLTRLNWESRIAADQKDAVRGGDRARD